MARLDRLALVKQVAQTAAVIGREFSHALLTAVSPLSEPDLDTALDQLVASELIFRRGTAPAATYSFKHALVQDAAYQSLLKSRCRQVHAQIAQRLEERFPKPRKSNPSCWRTTMLARASRASRSRTGEEQEPARSSAPRMRKRACI
jgi:predicted ATPase